MLLRRLVKVAISSSLTHSRADRLIGRLQIGRGAPIVLGYHRVVDDFDAHAGSTIPAMLTSRAMLEQHLDWLQPRFRFVTLDEIGQHLQEDRPFSEPVVALTFDDGYRDVYEQAFPMLRRRGIPAAVFVATDFVDRQIPLAHDRMYLLVRLALATDGGRATLSQMLGRRLPRPPSHTALDQAAYVITTGLLGSTPRTSMETALDRLGSVLGLARCLPIAQPLTWAMLAEMQRQGVTIGSHTAGHAVLTSETPASIADELNRSRTTIERRLGLPVRHFAYPDGRFNSAIVRSVAASRMPFAYTTCRHRHPGFPSLTIPRRLLWERSCVGPSGRFSPSLMSAHVHGVFEYVNACVEGHNTHRPDVSGPVSSADGAKRSLATHF